MTRKKRITLTLLVPAALAVFAVAYAASKEDKLGPYQLLSTISIPDLVGFDISWVDCAGGRYYLADRGRGKSTVPPRIDVIDPEHNKLLAPIPLSNAGNGVVAIHKSGDDDEQGEGESGKLVVGGTDSTAIFIDLAHPLFVPIAVSTGGKGRADELAFDPIHHLILIANDRAVDLFVTFITTTNPPHVVGKIFYDGSVPANPKSTGGIDTPVWDGANGRFYLAKPATGAHPNGEVDEIDPGDMKDNREVPH